MLSRVIAVCSRRVPSMIVPVYNNGLQLSSGTICQRSFGVFSSIKENLNEKMEEKKQKTQGWAFW